MFGWFRMFAHLTGELKPPETTLVEGEELVKSFNGLTMPFLLPVLAARVDADDDEALVQLGRTGEGGHGTRNSCPVSFHLKCHVISKNCFFKFSAIIAEFQELFTKGEAVCLPKLLAVASAEAATAATTSFLETIYAIVWESRGCSHSHSFH